MITPIFLSPPNAQHFNLNQDHHQGDLEHAIENFLFYSTSVSSHANLYLDQGLGSTTTYIMNDQSQAFNDQLEGSNTLLFNGESPSYGTQAVNSNGTYRSQDYNIFDFKKYEADQESNNLINSSEGITTDYNELRWMSSKMRMMRKLKNSRCPQIVAKGRSKIITSSNDQDQAHQLGIKTSSSNNNNGVIRVCSDCNTTKTPLWRSGPQGPKSLCNACGIRQRKARKAAMEAATQTGRTEISSTKTTSKVLKITNDKKKSRATSNTCVSQHTNKRQTPCNQPSDSDHKTSSITNNSSKERLSFKEFAVNLLRKNAAVHHRMFPQDEEEGALLLMALSYGLIQQI